MDKAIENRIDQLQQKFLEEPHTNCDASEAEALKQLFLNMSLATAGLTEGDEGCDKIMAETEEKLRDPKILGHKSAVAEAFFRRTALNPIDGYSYLDRTINDKNAGQAALASKPRPKSKDKITYEIERILSDNPKLSAKDVGRGLEACDEITLIEDEPVEKEPGIQFYHHDDGSKVGFSNLKSRVSEAKKRLKKKSG